MKNPIICVCIGIVLLIFMVELSAAQIDKSLVAFWSFDDGKGDTAKDNSKNGLDGKLIGNPKWVDGKANKALEFKG